MKLIYTHDNPFFVFNIRNILENNHIKCEVRNDILSSAAGEVPPTDVWPEIWVLHEKNYQKAEELVKLAIHGDTKATSWFCQNCNESNPPAFELCWCCGRDKETE